MTKRDQAKEETALAEGGDGNRSLALPSEPDSAGLSGEFGQQDIVIPICFLVQPMSQGKGSDGLFWFPDGTVLAEMDVVVLDIMATRTCWADVSEKIEGPLCRSADRRVGLTLYPDRIIGERPQAVALDQSVEVNCKECRLYGTASTFAKSDDGLWCPFGYTLLLADYGTEQPFLYFVKGMAVKTVKQRIVSPALMRMKQTGKAEPWRFVYHISSRLIEQPGRKYWTPDIAPDRELDEQERHRYAALSAELRPKAVVQVAQDPEPEGQAAFE